VAYLQEKANRLRARQVDLEAAEAELECQRWDFVWQQATHPLDNDDNACTGAPSGLCFSHVAYNMAAIACHLEDISNTSNLKTNEWLNEVRWLFRVALEQQVESSTSQRHAAFSRPSQTMTIVNGDYSDAHAPLAGRSSGDTSGNTSNRRWTWGAKP
jgi:hypothetical protein